MKMDGVTSKPEGCNYGRCHGNAGVCGKKDEEINDSVT